jgi:formate/nitrite transporter FocA (FNT family)
MAGSLPGVAAIVRAWRLIGDAIQPPAPERRRRAGGNLGPRRGFLRDQHPLVRRMAHPVKLGETRDEPSGAARGGLKEHEAQDVEERSQLRAPVIYEILRRDGEEEMSRPLASLWWSGVAAGLSIGFSLLAQAILQTHMPNAPWRPLVASLGYTVGFVIAVLARHQLFTENTITAVLPLAAAFSARNLARTARLWGVVLIANFAGTLCAALFYSFAQVLTPQLHDAMLEIAGQTMGNTGPGMFFKAIVAGFLMAAMVWLLPNAEGGKLQVIVLITYLISAGGFVHIVAGSLEAFMLMLAGQLSPWPALTHFVGPALAGNIIGGTLLFALISYGQVAEEV